MDSNNIGICVGVTTDCAKHRYIVESIFFGGVVIVATNVGEAIAEVANILIFNNCHCYGVVALVHTVAVKVFGGGRERFVNLAEPRCFCTSLIEVKDFSVFAVERVHIGAYKVMCHYCLFQEVIRFSVWYYCRADKTILSSAPVSNSA